MKSAEWMNARVREEIESLQSAYGFDEDEAVAFWHLRQARRLMSEMKRRDLQERIDRKQKSESDLGAAYLTGGMLAGGISELESAVYQHYSALHKELGRRVLRRNYPEGWGRAYREAAEEQG